MKSNDCCLSSDLPLEEETRDHCSS